jgi:hypothetical protein
MFDTQFNDEHVEKVLSHLGIGRKLPTLRFMPGSTISFFYLGCWHIPGGGD